MVEMSSKPLTDPAPAPAPTPAAALAPAPAAAPAPAPAPATEPSLGLWVAQPSSLARVRWACVRGHGRSTITLGGSCDGGKGGGGGVRWEGQEARARWIALCLRAASYIFAARVRAAQQGVMRAL